MFYSIIQVDSVVERNKASCTVCAAQKGIYSVQTFIAMLKRIPEMSTMSLCPFYSEVSPVMCILKLSFLSRNIKCWPCAFVVMHISIIACVCAASSSSIIRLSVCLERLVESLRLPQVPILHAQVFLFFRVLLLRMSPQHLTSLWPTMITELVSTRCSFHFFFSLLLLCLNVN